MSLILDALRKSEHERQREAGPALSVIPESQPERGMPKWVPALVALLALNIVVLALVLLRDRPAAPETGQAAVVPAPAGAQGGPSPGAAATSPGRDAPLELPHRPARQEVRPLTTELPTTPRPGRAPAATAQSSAAISPGTVETAGSGVAPAQSAPRSNTAAATPSARAADDARLPRFADLVVRGELSVPHMHLDIHVYSDDPAQRFVFINMRRYNEGQAAQEGPRIQRIVPGGVVMEHQGQRFLLTRD